MRFGPRIEPITFPTLGGCATNYATDAGQPRPLRSLVNMKWKYVNPVNQNTFQTFETKFVIPNKVYSTLNAQEVGHKMLDKLNGTYTLT